MKTFHLLTGVLLGTSLLTLVSCGNSGGGSNSSSASQPQIENEQADDHGIYRAVLGPLNTAAAGNVSGTIEIKIDGDDVSVRSNVIGAPAGVKHLQNIMTASACPDASSDSNGDTFIDVKEMIAKTGKILLPLDSDLSTQLNGMDYGPIANGAGAYIYRRSTSLTQLMSDLQDRDPDLADPVVKLEVGENHLSLSRRVVIIHGVKSTSQLPETVATLDGTSSELLMPIACGKLVRVNSEEPTTTETVSSNEGSATTL